MIYLLGGTARAGKSTLAHRIDRELGIPVASTDVLCATLAGVIPELAALPPASS